MISEEWLVRVFLSKPCASGRGLAQSFRDIAGSDICTVGRASIARVRDAWVEMYKPMVMLQCAELVTGAVQHAAATGAAFAPIFFLHVQDEADIRLRSGDARDGPTLPNRSGASKVQQNVLTIVGNSDRTDVPTELEALGDKSAATLATSFERLLRSVAASILPAPQPQAWRFRKFSKGGDLARGLALPPPILEEELNAILFCQGRGTPREGGATR